MPTAPEVEIFSRVIDPSNPTLKPEAARALLELGYTPADHARMAELAKKSNEGSITAKEGDELEGYVFVGDVLAMLKSKARASLQAHSTAA